MNKGKKFLKILTGAILLLIVVGVVIMLLWNWLVPQLFNGSEISFWQALGLFLLARILFGSWGGKCRGAQWKGRYIEKLSAMSPEDRERFKKRMSEKWCYGGHQKETPTRASND